MIMFQPWPVMLSLFKGLRKGSGHGSSRRRPARATLLKLEPLEERSLLSISGTGFNGMNYDPSQ
jgi:hypothetical protein